MLRTANHNHLENTQQPAADCFRRIRNTGEGAMCLDRPPTGFRSRQSQQNLHYVVKNAGDRASPERALQQSPFDHFLKIDVKGTFCISVIFYGFVVS